MGHCISKSSSAVIDDKAEVPGTISTTALSAVHSQPETTKNSTAQSASSPIMGHCISKKALAVKDLTAADATISNDKVDAVKPTPETASDATAPSTSILVMGDCVSRKASAVKDDTTVSATISTSAISTVNPPQNDPMAPSTSGVQTSSPQSPWFSPYTAGFKSLSARSTPRRLLPWPFPPPSPAKPIRTDFLKRQGKKNPKDGLTPEREEEGREMGLDKNYGFPKHFGSKYELGKEVGRGHFGHTCRAKGKKGDVKGQSVAVKIISKAKITSAIAVEDVRREVKILKSLSGHKHMLKFYEAFEDSENVYIVMELCEGGELLERILAKGGKYTEEDAKSIIVQILSAVAFCHLQGVVHRDLKPENFLFTSSDEDATLKIIDFGLSDFVRPDQWLNDVVGSAYYVAPEVLHQSYNVEGDMWSVGVVTYILLCGSRPFWAKTESGVFDSVLQAEPNFKDSPWPGISKEAKDFVRRLLNKDYRKRMTAVQALCHPWLRDENRLLPLDILIYKLVKSYVHATPFKRAALKALSKALTEEELFYIRVQFQLLEPSDGYISFESFKLALARNATDAMRESRVLEILNSMVPLSSIKMDFEGFCAATTSIYQLEALEGWDKIATRAFGYFEQKGNRFISVEELAREMKLTSAAYPLAKDWIRNTDGKLSFLGFTKLLHGVKIRSDNARC